MLTDAVDPMSFPEPFRTRVQVWRHTEHICKNLPASTQSTKMFVKHCTPIKRYEFTRMEVRDQDSLAAARSLLRSGKTIGVLNMADDAVPCGYPSSGSGAQEESIARSSTLCQSLDMHMYPIQDDAGIYSKDVVVFKDTEANNFRCIKPFRVDILTVPGVRHPCLDENGLMKEQDLVRMRDKITLMYEMAQKNGVIMETLRKHSKE